jgi:predicted AAA+ superfamily ATPase
MEKQVIKTIIADQQTLYWKNQFVIREFPANLLLGEDIIVISGIRRCGKSTLLHQIRNTKDERDYYLNFDDDRLIHFKVEDFQQLLEIFIEMFGVQKTLYFDEIQNIDGWERFVRRLHDQGYKIFITGSNARMLSRELGTHLSGRYISYELYPFSFSEYLRFQNSESNPNSILSTEMRGMAQKHFQDYFKYGGFPAFIKNQNPDYLRNLYDSILYRDIMVRNNLTNEKEMTELVFYLAGNISRPLSYNALSKTIGIANASTISKYVGFFRDSYFIFLINKFDFSYKKQLQNPKKVYFIDNALARNIGFFFSDDLGRMLENMVFIHLMRNQKDVFYHKNKVECDFVVRQGNTITEAIQVSYTMENETTRAREINGLVTSAKSYGLNTGTIITMNDEYSLTESGFKIDVIPAWKWLLENER